jgi:hypothetical protein
MQNFRYAFGLLGRQPLFTAIVILTFALGIGANTAVSSVLNAVLLRPLPFREPQNLVALGEYDLREKSIPQRRPIPSRISIMSIGGIKIASSSASPFAAHS